MGKRLPLITIITLILALLALAFGYWGRWIAHPAAALNILGVDLPEYVKFVPEVRYGDIQLNRLVFFAMPASLALGLILFASMRMHVSLWLRGLAGLLAVPVALSMLPPAWTPVLLMTAEFRVQTVIIMALIAAVFLIPLLKQLIPDWWRGVFLILLGMIPIAAVRAFLAVKPALEKLYNHPLRPGPGFYWLLLGMALMIAAGVLLILVRRKQPKTADSAPVSVENQG